MGSSDRLPPAGVVSRSQADAPQIRSLRDCGPDAAAVHADVIGDFTFVYFDAPAQRGATDSGKDATDGDKQA